MRLPNCIPLNQLYCQDGDDHDDDEGYLHRSHLELLQLLLAESSLLHYLVHALLRII